MNLSRPRAALLATLMVSGALLLARLPKVGLFYWDQAYYSVEARTAWEILRQVPRFLKGTPIGVIKEEVHQKSGGIFPTGVAKPSLALSLMIVSALANFKDYSIALLASVSGWLCVWIVFHLGRSLKNERAGAWSAALLCFSTLHIYLSRGGFPNVPAMGLFLLALYLMFNGRSFLSGLISGLAFTFHYGLFLNFVLLLAQFTFNRFFRKENGFSFQPLRWIAGLLIVPLVWEALYQAVLVALGPYLADVGLHSYFYYLKRQFFLSSPASSAQVYWNPWFYPRIFVHTHGWGYVLLFFLASVWAVTAALRGRLGPKEHFVIWPAFALTFAWIANPGINVVRIVEFFLPLQCLMMGSFLAEVPRRTYMKTLLFIAAVLPAMPSIYKIMNYRSGYSAASEFMLNEGPGRVVMFENGPVWHFYLGPQHLFYSQLVDFSEENIRTAVRKNEARYFVMDYAEDYARAFNLVDEPRKNWVSKVISTSNPVRTVENPVGCDEITMYDRQERHVNTPLAALTAPGDPLAWLKEHPEACLIRIYDLRGRY